MHRALGIGVLVIAASFGVLFATAPPATAANVYIDLYGSLSGWSTTSGAETNPGPTFTTDVGDQINLNLTSDDGLPHSFHLDLDGDNQSVGDPSEPLSGSTTTTTTFSFSAPPGTYWYRCGVHGWSMRGVWTIRTAAANDTTPPNIASVTVSPGSPAVNDNVRIAASVTDNDVVANVSAHVVGPSFDQNLTMTEYLGGPTWQVDHVFTQAGSYTVTIWARDAAGNNDSASTTFTVSTSSTPPGGNPPGDNTGLWAAVAAVVIILFLLLALAMWRRGAKKGEPPKKPESPET